MKKTIAIFTIAAMFAACKNNTTPNNASVAAIAADTSGLAAFQQYKEQQRIIEQQKMFETEGVYDGTNNMANGYAPNAVQAAPVRERIVYVDRPSPRRTATTTTRRRSTSRNTGYSNSGSNGTYASTPAPARKKGWSKAAKGAVIGGASGAVVGAVVSKKKGKGAVIGGALGALGGYVIGRGQDKRDGRY